METFKFLILFSFFYFFSQINSLSEWWEHTNAVELNNENFFDYIGKDKYVVVKFFTKWCHYCRKMSPQYEKLHDYYQNRRDDLIIARVECSDNEYLALQYNIPSYPTVALFYPNDTKLVKKFNDERKLDRFVAWIEKYAPKLENQKASKPSYKNTEKKIEKHIDKPSENKTKSIDSFTSIKLEKDNLIKEHMMHIKEANNSHLQIEDMELVKKEIMDLMTRTSLLERQIKTNLSQKKFLISEKKPDPIHNNEVVNKPKNHMRVRHDPYFSFPFIVAIALLISISVGGILTIKRLIIQSNLKEN